MTKEASLKGLRAFYVPYFVNPMLDSVSGLVFDSFLLASEINGRIFDPKA